ncbi:unnamed protein product [Cladocopium goreaui]|uniref:Dual-specificity kinase n=1 Tax=Cladocopium goreaui TaxID=2562237 RepID=A0A9P1GME5_9DINO|nr:unnamed protein product [Cladocopium goreaui]
MDMDELRLDEHVTLPGDWPNLLRGGQIFTALLLSTSYSEKYRGRKMVPWGSAAAAENARSFDHNAELQIPSSDRHQTRRPALLHRSGNREAVAFIWRGDPRFDDCTIYVCFSPLRYRTQFLKIWCAGLAENGMNVRRAAQQTTDLTLGTCDDVGHCVTLPVSTYLKVKLDRLWDPEGQRLYDKLLQSVRELPGYRVIFSGISHGAALAQAAALRFQLQQPETQVFVVAWNAYRWTDTSGRKLAEDFLGSRLLHFVLSRRDKAQPQATRYWDSVTGFPQSFAPMHNPVLLDADTGDFYKHTAPEQGSQFGATFLMQMFELHFARSALGAMKKATATARGFEDDLSWNDYLRSRRLEVFQTKLINQAQKVAAASHRAQKIIRRTSHGVGMRRQISHEADSTTSSMASLETPLRLRNEFGGAPLPRISDIPNGTETDGTRPSGKSWFGRLAWCCS